MLAPGDDDDYPFIDDDEECDHLDTDYDPFYDDEDDDEDE